MYCTVREVLKGRLRPKERTGLGKPHLTLAVDGRQPSLMAVFYCFHVILLGFL